MFLTKKLEFEVSGIGKCDFKSILPCDVSSEYLDSLNAEQKYLETKSLLMTRDMQTEYVEFVGASPSQALCGIFREEGILMATGGIQKIGARVPTIGIFVFNSWRRKGLGKALVWACCKYLAEFTPAAAVSAGVKADNKPSLHSFLSCGFLVKEKSKNHNIMECDITLCRRPECVGSDHKWVSVE